MVRLPATNPAQKTNFLILYLRWGEGSPTSVLGSQPIIWLLSFSPSCVRRSEVTMYQHLLIPLCDLHSSLTFFWWLDTVSNFISLLPVGYRMTISIGQMKNIFFILHLKNGHARSSVHFTLLFIQHLNSFKKLISKFLKPFYCTKTFSPDDDSD